MNPSEYKLSDVVDGTEEECETYETWQYQLKHMFHGIVFEYEPQSAENICLLSS